MSIDKKVLTSAKQRVIERLSDLGVTKVLGFDRHSAEDIFFLRVEVPDGDTLRVLDEVDSLLSEIAQTNDFMLVVVPYRPISSDQPLIASSKPN
jgi:hypothetical protein